MSELYLLNSISTLDTDTETKQEQYFTEVEKIVELLNAIGDKQTHECHVTIEHHPSHKAKQDFEDYFENWQDWVERQDLKNGVDYYANQDRTEFMFKTYGQMYEQHGQYGYVTATITVKLN